MMIVEKNRSISSSEAAIRIENASKEEEEEAEEGKKERKWNERIGRGEEINVERTEIRFEPLAFGI